MTTKTELLERTPRWVLPARGERVLCAVSGGLDSMCLLFLLDAWCREQGGELAAAHFNHQLRGGPADRDEAFVRETCEKWGISLTAGRRNVREYAKENGLSLEEAARTLRYRFLRQTAEERQCKRLYTAHHADDNAETVLLNLIRGTGLKGLTGMDWERTGLCRPLLRVTRKELEDYAARWKIPHIEDETNADPETASRNFLRLRVLPLFKELNPRAVEHIAQTAGRLQEADRFLEAEAAARTAPLEVREGQVRVPVDLLFRAPEAVRPRMLLQLFDCLGVGRKDIGAVHLNALLRMANPMEAGRESQLSLPCGVTAQCRRRWLILETRSQRLTEVPLLPGQPLRWGEHYTLTLLNSQAGAGITLRDRTPGEPWDIRVGPCPPGERLLLPGTRGARSVKRLCLDRKISLAERNCLPAIYVGKSLAAVWRLGVDAAFAPKDGVSCRFIKIEESVEEDDHDAQ